MLDKLGPWIVWALFLGTVWLCAKPILIFLTALGIAFAVILGVVCKLERQGEEVAKGWKKEDKEGK